MKKHMDEDPEPANIRNPNVSAECATLIGWVMQKEREARPQSWQELLQNIDAILSGDAVVDGGPAATDDIAAPKKKRKKKKKKKSGCMGVVAALAALGVTGGYLLIKLIGG